MRHLIFPLLFAVLFCGCGKSPNDGRPHPEVTYIDVHFVPANMFYWGMDADDTRKAAEGKQYSLEYEGTWMPDTRQYAVYSFVTGDQSRVVLFYDRDESKSDEEAGRDYNLLTIEVEFYDSVPYVPGEPFDDQAYAERYDEICDAVKSAFNIENEYFGLRFELETANALAWTTVGYTAQTDVNLPVSVYTDARYRYYASIEYSPPCAL